MGERTIELDPNFVCAWAHLGITHLLDATILGGKSPAQSIKRPEECAQKAISINYRSKSIAHAKDDPATINQMTRKG